MDALLGANIWFKRFKIKSDIRGRFQTLGGEGREEKREKEGTIMTLGGEGREEKGEKEGTIMDYFAENLCKTPKLMNVANMLHEY